MRFGKEIRTFQDNTRGRGTWFVLKRYFLDGWMCRQELFFSPLLSCRERERERVRKKKKLKWHRRMKKMEGDGRAVRRRWERLERERERERVWDDVSSAGLVQVTTSQDGVWKLPSACPVDSPSHPNNEGRQLESRHAIQLRSQRVVRRLLFFLYTLLRLRRIPWQPFYV